MAPVGEVGESVPRRGECCCAAVVRGRGAGRRDGDVVAQSVRGAKWWLRHVAQTPTLREPGDNVTVEISADHRVSAAYRMVRRGDKGSLVECMGCVCRAGEQDGGGKTEASGRVSSIETSAGRGAPGRATACGKVQS